MGVGRWVQRGADSEQGKKKYQGDWWPPPAGPARFVTTGIIPRRYSGVSADVVSGFAVLAARSPTASAKASSMALPARMAVAPFNSIGAGFTAVIATRASATCPLVRLIATATPATGYSIHPRPPHF